MHFLKPPSPMNCNASNVAKARDKWSARYNNYHTALEVEEKKLAVQVAILLELASPDALAIRKTFTFSDGEKDDDYKVCWASWLSGSVRNLQARDRRFIPRLG